jgi:hypothetical protein
MSPVHEKQTALGAFYGLKQGLADGTVGGHLGILIIGKAKL